MVGAIAIMCVSLVGVTMTLISGDSGFESRAGLCTDCPVGAMVRRLTTECDTVAEWLRRSTRNRLGLSRVGSSPASVALCTILGGIL